MIKTIFKPTCFQSCRSYSVFYPKDTINYIEDYDLTYVINDNTKLTYLNNNDYNLKNK